MADRSESATRVCLERNGQVAWITLDRPKGNVLDREMVREIRVHLGALAHQDRLKLVVFEGAGKHFSFGASVAEHLPGEFEKMIPEFHGMFADMDRLACPTAAVVRGQCLGGAFELAAWCGWVFAHPDAVLGQPEVKLAVFPPVATLALRWRGCGRLATDLVTTGRVVRGSEARAHGLVDELTEDPAEACLAWFDAQLASLSAAGLRKSWEAGRRALTEEREAAIPTLENLYFRGMEHPDPVEGLTAFLEKRQPAWSA